MNKKPKKNENVIPKIATKFYPTYCKEIDDLFKKIQTEPNDKKIQFTNEELSGYKEYFKPILNTKSGTYKWFGAICGKSRRVTPVLNTIMESPDCKILDSGCGMGIDSLFFSMQGAKVVGVDIDTDRINIARKRLKYYNKQGTLKNEVEFHLQNIFRFLSKKDREYDLVWANESISHIEPPLEYLKHVHKALKDKGTAIISDPNKFNPVLQIKMFKRRRFKLYDETQDPHTGEIVKLADERYFSIGEISNLLNEAGFQIKEIYRGALIPIILRNNRFYPSIRMWELRLKEFPLFSNLIGGYTIVAVK